MKEDTSYSNSSYRLCPRCKGRKWDRRIHDGNRRTCPICVGKGSIPIKPKKITEEDLNELRKRRKRFLFLDWSADCITRRR